MAIIYREFKDRLKQRRGEFDISAIDLANKLGKSESAIRMWESGKTKPDADTLIVLASLLDCTTDWLLGISEYVNYGDWAVHKQKNDNILNELSSISSSDDRRVISDLFLCMLNTYSALDVLVNQDWFKVQYEKSITIPEYLRVTFVHALKDIVTNISMGVGLVESAYSEEKINNYRMKHTESEIEKDSAMVHMYFSNANLTANSKHNHLWKLLKDQLDSVLPPPSEYPSTFFEYMFTNDFTSAVKATENRGGDPNGKHNPAHQ